MMIDRFNDERSEQISSMKSNVDLRGSAQDFIKQANRAKYSYHFDWLGRPIIQYPQDIVAIQELIWSVRPDLIIETGIARGGSLILSASMLSLLDLTDAIEGHNSFDPFASNRTVVGIDIEIRKHNREAIEEHPLSHKIKMIEGSSIDQSIVETVAGIASNFEKVMVFLDSNHTHDHVLAELEAYAWLTTIGSYCVVFDTIVEDLPADMFPDRPWGPGNNPKTAVDEFLRGNKCFETDEVLDAKLQISVAPKGYLRRIT